MKKSRAKLTIFLVTLVVILFLIFFINQVIYLRKAHSTFENYYAFRGCTQLLKRTSDYGLCKTTSGETIKIVKYNNKWYLDGDLPVCYFNICF